MFGIIFFSSMVVGLVGYLTIVTVVAHRLLQPHRRQSLVAPADIGLAYEDITFKARGEDLTIAAWHIPAAGATRAVIIAHGVGGSRGREFTVSSLELVEHLIGSGYAVLMLDLRGHGKSDAAYMTYGIRERRDLLGATDWLLARGYAPGAIGVLGLSMGGVAGIGALGEEPAIGALIIDSACADFLAMMRLHFRRASKLPLFFLPGALQIARLLIGEDLARLRPAELLSGVARRPTMIIHSQGDRLVPVSHGRALAQAGEAELWVVRSAHHLGAFAADTHTYIQRVIQFFDHALASPDKAAGEVDLARLSIIRAGEASKIDTIAQMLAQRSSAAREQRDELRMRWHMTRHGLRMRWEKIPHKADDSEAEISDNTEEAARSVGELV